MTIVIAIIIAIIAFFLIVMVIDCNRFVIREYQCESNKLQKDENIILLSDLHNKSFGKSNCKLISAIDKLHPDRILIAGDMYTSTAGGSTQVAQQLVNQLAMRYQVYYCNGNHEQKTKLFPEQYGKMYEQYVQAVQKGGTCFLLNERVNLSVPNIDIYGLEIEPEYYGKFKNRQMKPEYLERRLGKPNPSAFSILLAHNPDYFQAYSQWGADLVLSGHVHGGLMRLPVLGGVISPALRIFPHFDGGEFRLGQAVMILSRGLGTHTLPIRIFNPGELVSIKCRKVDG